MRYVNLIRNVSNWHEYLLHKYGIRRRDRFVFRLANGVEAEVPKEMLFTFKELFFDDDYFRGFPSTRFTGEPINVVDVGANVGYFSLYIFAKFPGSSVVALEPIETNLRLLEANRARNDSQSWELIASAVSAEAGQIVLKMSPDDSFTTDASIFDNPRGNKEIVVESRRLDEVVLERVSGEVDLLKLDCEGAEYEILHSCTDELFRKIRAIVVETHPGPGPEENKAALGQHLEAHGYEVKTDHSPFIWAWR